MKSRNVVFAAVPLCKQATPCLYSGDPDMRLGLNIQVQLLLALTL